MKEVESEFKGRCWERGNSEEGRGERRRGVMVEEKTSFPGKTGKE